MGFPTMALGSNPNKDLGLDPTALMVPSSSITRTKRRFFKHPKPRPQELRGGQMTVIQSLEDRNERRGEIKAIQSLEQGRWVAGVEQSEEMKQN